MILFMDDIPLLVVVRGGDGKLRRYFDCSGTSVVDWIIDGIDDIRQRFVHNYQDMLQYTGLRFKNYTW